ncbi:MAG: DUF3261 domain-containing protein [Proteobacteria bacterium]|nr:DUF3261 domain-containing protein [Pseudomonadota bacterium]
MRLLPPFALRSLAVPLVLALAACGPPDPRCAALPGGGRYCLQPSTALAPFDAQQKVEARLSGRRETMIVELENDAAGMRFAALTPFGHTLLQASYDNHTATAATLPNPRLEPALPLALVQLALWPAAAVRDGLDSLLTLDDSGEHRRILRDGETTLQIDYLGDMHSDDRGPDARHRRLRVSVPSAQIELDIETLPHFPLAAPGPDQGHDVP